MRLMYDNDDEKQTHTSYVLFEGIGPLSPCHLLFAQNIAQVSSNVAALFSSSFDFNLLG